MSVAQGRITVGMANLPTSPHRLYRFFDRTDALLYVGVTMNLPQRLKRHRGTKEWWLDVATMTAEPFESRSAVLLAEKEAIRTEHPLYNDQHNPTVMVTAPLTSTGDAEPCGEDCTPECREHHDIAWNCVAREDLALTIIELIGRRLGHPSMKDAIEYAQGAIKAPEGERGWPGEIGGPVIAAMYMAQETTTEYVSLVEVAQRVFDSVDPGLRARASSATDRDISLAEKADLAPRLRLLYDLRHLARLIETGGECV